MPILLECCNEFQAVVIIFGAGCTGLLLSAATIIALKGWFNL